MGDTSTSKRKRVSEGSQAAASPPAGSPAAQKTSTARSPTRSPQSPASAASGDGEIEAGIIEPEEDDVVRRHSCRYRNQPYADNALQTDRGSVTDESL